MPAQTQQSLRLFFIYTANINSPKSKPIINLCNRTIYVFDFLTGNDVISHKRIRINCITDVFGVSRFLGIDSRACFGAFCRVYEWQRLSVSPLHSDFHGETRRFRDGLLPAIFAQCCIRQNYGKLGMCKSNRRLYLR